MTVFLSIQYGSIVDIIEPKPRCKSKVWRAIRRDAKAGSISHVNVTSEWASGDVVHRVSAYEITAGRPLTWAGSAGILTLAANARRAGRIQEAKAIVGEARFMRTGR